MVVVGIIEYNRPEFTSMAIHSAHDNAGIDHEILLVVNSPRTESQIDAKAKGLARQPITINPSNFGYTRAANQIIRMAGDQDVVLLNSDTTCSKDWLKYLKEAAYVDTHDIPVRDRGKKTGKQGQRIGMAMPRLVERFGLHKGKYCAHAGSGCMKTKGDITLGRGWFGFAVVYLRRDALDDLGLLKEDGCFNYGSDREYGERSAARGYWYAHTHRATIQHICQGSQIRTRNWA